MKRYTSRVEEISSIHVTLLPEDVPQRLPLDVLHHQEVVVPGLLAHRLHAERADHVLVHDPLPDLRLALEARERIINERRVREARFELQVGDYMVMLSDGYEHAGLGGVYRLGWGWDNIVLAVQRFLAAGISDTYKLAQSLSHTCLRLYDNRPGDDSTAVVMHVRPERKATVMTGPPSDAAQDRAIVAKLTGAEGVKVICGGTTAQIAARVLGKELKVEWVPPSKRQGRPSRKTGTPPTAQPERTPSATPQARVLLPITGR